MKMVVVYIEAGSVK